MTIDRVFSSADFLQPADGEPIRSVISQSQDAAIIAWYVKPGQGISAHIHPEGQDTWTMLSGCAEYQLEANGQSRTLSSGDVAVAPRGCVHGAHNPAPDAFIFVSVVCPSQSGFELVPAPPS